MKIKCTVVPDCDLFTEGQEYEVSYIDPDGDLWVICDDDDYAFLSPEECEVIEE